MRIPTVAALLAAAILLTASPAPAVFNKPISLKNDALREELIFTATCESVAPDRPAVVFKVDGKLKGDPPFEKLAVNLTGNAEAKKGGHTKVMLDRLEPGRKMVAFSSKRGKRYNAVAFMEGTWFSLQGTVDDDGKTVRWAFLSCEPNLRGTFKGTTAELKQVVEDGLAGRAEPPPPNEKEPPGFGPPIKKCDDPFRPELPTSDLRSEIVRDTRINSGPLFAVIPSVVLVGPLAILAALFPGVAARMAVGMKKWRAFLVVASLNSTFAIAFYFTQKYLPDTPAFTLTAFTVYLMAITAVGLAWAGRRYRRMAADEPGVTETPGRTELWSLAGLTLLAAGIAASVRFFGPWSTALELPMREFTFIAAALLVATGYAGYRAFTAAADHAADGSAPPVRLSVSGESVGLGSLFLCGLVSVLLTTGRNAPPAVALAVPDNGEVKLTNTAVFEIAGADQVMSGIAVSGDRLFLGTSTIKVSSQDGSLVCLDRNTGQVIWKYEADDDLKPVFSTPRVAGGRVYFGEGLHTHTDCRFFCVDAATGKLAWEKPFATASHTEGTPLVLGERVVFTAGDDGLICADAKTGARKWQAGGHEKKLHIDGPPAAAGNRVFAGSGIYTTALLAFDADTGVELWRTPVPLRSFGPPLVVENRVVFGLGTGNMMSDTFDYDEEKGSGRPPETEPAGAVVCVEASTGKVAWQYDLTRSVHTPLAADGLFVYATSRDGCVHCLNRKNGKLRWKTPLGVTITAGPAVVADEDGFPVAVYAVSTEGTVACLNPHTGRPFWVRDMREHTDRLVEDVVCTPAVVSDGKKRTVYVGAMVKNRNNGAKTAAVFRFDDTIGE